MALALLNSSFRPLGVHTAASSSQSSDGAAAVSVMSARKASELDIAPLARLVLHCIVEVDPILRLIGPIPVTRKLLGQLNVAANEIDLYEVNEAFAGVVLAWLSEIGAELDRVNVNGGAIALGLPVGATSARLITTVVHELVRRGSGDALVAMCCGLGLGTGIFLVRDEC